MGRLYERTILQREIARQILPKAARNGKRNTHFSGSRSYQPKDTSRVSRKMYQKCITNDPIWSVVPDLKLKECPNTCGFRELSQHEILGIDRPDPAPE